MSRTKARRRRSTDVAAPADARLLTRAQVARRLGISVVTVDRWTRRGILRPVDMYGLRRRLYSADEIDQIVEERVNAS
jgi:excisionase family DNA binding protein